MIDWNFPSNNHGQLVGLNNAGIETFRGNPIESLAREINQNSLDAARSDIDEPVEVHFECYDVPRVQFPFEDKFKNILKACKDYWISNSDAKEFFEKALDVVKKEKIRVLKVSDYNTTGLTGSEGNPTNSNWHSLIKSVGSSNKSSGAGGSFGIGKHAPFACSYLRTVFYGTKDYEGKRAFQGVAKLVTHENNEENLTQGTGYFGIVDQNRPIKDFTKLDDWFCRSEIGTDIFIPGFKGGEEWETEIIKSVLENFLVAIKEERLVVKVGEIIIDSDNLSSLLKQYIEEDSDYLADKYYKSMLSSDNYIFNEKNFEDLGAVKLYILPEKDYPKRVAMVRSTGMKIFDKGHFHTPLKFAGVMIAEGKELNEFLRSLEPPSHNTWQPDRHENPKYAKKIRRKLYSWINEMVKSISEKEDVEELDVEGMSQYLPDDLDDNAAGEDEDIEDIEKTTKKIEITRRNRRRNRITSTTAEETAVSSANEGGSPNNDNQNNDNDGGSSSIKLGGGSQDEGTGGRNNSNQGNKQSKKSTPIQLVNSRVFCTDPENGVYNAIVNTNSSREAFLTFKIVGEDDKDYVPIESAKKNKSDESIKVKSKGKIGPIEFEKEKKQSISIVLEDSLRCAMEVSLDEN